MGKTGGDRNHREKADGSLEARFSDEAAGKQTLRSRILNVFAGAAGIGNRNAVSFILAAFAKFSRYPIEIFSSFSTKRQKKRKNRKILRKIPAFFDQNIRQNRKSMVNFE